MSGNFQRLGDLAAMEEHDFGEVWRAFLAGLPVADFDDATAAEDSSAGLHQTKRAAGADSTPSKNRSKKEAARR
jgi:hypothetical protein